MNNAHLNNANIAQESNNKASGGELPQKQSSNATFSDVYALLKREYKHERFEGRNGSGWGEDYSHCVAKSHMDRLKKFGWTLISRHESKNGEAQIFDSNLELIKEI